MTPPSLPPTAGGPSASGGTGEGAVAPPVVPGAGEAGEQQAAVGGTAAAPDAPGRRRRRWWLWGIAALLMLGAVLGVLFVPTPYVLIQPGAVRPADERIEVTGARSYEDEGDVLFTTVYVDRATLFGLMRGSVDDAIDVRTQDEVYGVRGRDETREFNRQQMDVSKLVATMAALDVLGYETRFAAEGAHVLEVTEDAPAASQIRPGDVIVAVDGVAVELPADLRAALSAKAVGDDVTVSIRRPVAPSGESASGDVADTERLDVVTTLTSSDEEADPLHAVLGVSVEPWNPTVDSEVDVEIDSGAVTGPSAGLAWALAVIDALSPGSLTGERDVAVTGEILSDGSIGVIGGVGQKVATVARNGVEVFLYPAGTPDEEQQEMRRIAGDDVELVAVGTLAEAVEYFAPDGLPGQD